MSMAPRPQTAPSRTIPAKGWTDQSSARACTTSRWPRNASEGPSPEPGRRATRFGRAGSFDTRSHSSPASARYASSTSAAFRSSPGGFEVSQAISRCNSGTTSSVVEGRCLGLLDEPTGETRDSFALGHIALAVGPRACEQRARALQVPDVTCLGRVRLEVVEQPRDAVARRLLVARVEVDEPTANTVAVRAPGVLDDPMALVHRQPLPGVEQLAEPADEGVHDGDDGGGVVDRRLRVGQPELDRPVGRMQAHLPPEVRRVGEEPAATSPFEVGDELFPRVECRRDARPRVD